MKRIGNLFERVTSYDNLLMSFHLAMKGCGKTGEACRFFYHLEPELIRLRNQLVQETYRPGPYRYFTIYDPKERVIAVAPFRDRVVHHAVVGILTPPYEQIFIHDSYATRADKGTHKAIRRAQSYLRRWQWYLKLDVKQYFYSVDHGILMGLLRRKLKDRRLLNLLERLIWNPRFPGKGLPIGNLTSQFLANVYLDPLDHEVKDHIGVLGYVRYMDDMVVFGDDKRALMKIKSKMEAFLESRLALALKSEVTCLNRASHGLSFLGMRIFPRFIRVRPENRRRSLKRMEQTVKEWHRGRIGEAHMAHSLNSTIGHLRYFCPNAEIPFGGRAV